MNFWMLFDNCERKFFPPNSIVSQLLSVRNYCQNSHVVEELRWTSRTHGKKSKFLQIKLTKWRTYSKVSNVYDNTILTLNAMTHCGVIQTFCMTQDIDLHWTLMVVVMNCRVPYNFLSNCVGLPRGTPLLKFRLVWVWNPVFHVKGQTWTVEMPKREEVHNTFH